MRFKKSLVIFSLVLVLTVVTVSSASAGFMDFLFGNDQGEVNLYTNRHYDTDEELLDKFEEKTGIEVNVLKGGSDELIERIDREGADTQADLLITADAGRLHRAKSKGLLQSATTDTLTSNIPQNLRDTDNQWFGLTVRGRVVVYDKDEVDPDEIDTYQDLTADKWEDEILVRSSSNIYNQSLLASLIATHGEEAATEWAQGIVDNMARRPKGNDRAQALAIAADKGDLAIMNTYYLGKMLNSSEEQQVKVAQEDIDILFPEPTHINVSGVGLTKHAKNKENAIKLMEFLSSKEAQQFFAEANYEYPVNPDVEPSDLLKSWGDFEAQDIDLTKLGELNEKAVKIFNKVGWQ
ncbi:Fe(3+) ABC transporter substrate-binding protein [Halanaerobaculum tunisiense]